MNLMSSHHPVLFILRLLVRSLIDDPIFQNSRHKVRTSRAFQQATISLLDGKVKRVPQLPTK